MSSSERFGLCAALLLALGGCAQELGAGPSDLRFGEAARAMQLGQGGAPDAALLAGLAQDFAASVPTEANFAFNRADLDAGAQAALAQQAAWLLDNRQAAIRIVGHTDAVGTERANQRLGQRRAETAARFLIAQGVAAERIAAIDSRGEAEPVVATQARERRNRRVVSEVAWLGRAPRPVSEMDGVRAQLVFDNYQALKNAVTETTTEQ